MDSIVEAVGRKNNCTFCGVFRRQALDRGAAQLRVDHIITGMTMRRRCCMTGRYSSAACSSLNTNRRLLPSVNAGHNADDIAETVLMNSRSKRGVDIHSIFTRLF